MAQRSKPAPVVPPAGARNSPSAFGLPAARPNIVLILADDMGFSDIGCYGSEINTPNLDALARGGVRFTQMYNCARCCPTRASLLTGLYPHQAGIGLMCGDLGLPGYQGRLSDNCVTIAEALKGGGYRTMMSGKWHVGGDYNAVRSETWEVRDEKHPRPLDRGFDEFYGILDGYANYYNPHSLLRGNEVIAAGGDDYYLTDAIADSAADMIRRHAGEPDPFFLYVAFTAPHWPLHARPRDIEKYRGRYVNGWDAARIARHERLIADGILDARWPISPREPQAPPWSEIQHREWEDLRMAVYAAQVDSMDQGVGRIMDALRAQGREDNTLVFFLSDNGGCAEYLRENGYAQDKVPTTRNGKPVYLGNTPGVAPGPEDTFLSYDLPWANVSNAPFRYYKHWVHEGGAATPLIAHWPALGAPGAITHEPSHVIDIMATCLDAAGVAYPQFHNGHEITPLEGKSLLPLLCGQTRRRQNPLFWEHEGNCAVRDGEWKLVRSFGGDWELYNMIEDRTELSDLAVKDRRRVEDMARLHAQWAARSLVVPWERIRKPNRPNGAVWRCF